MQCTSTACGVNIEANFAQLVGVQVFLWSEGCLRSNTDLVAS